MYRTPKTGAQKTPASQSGVSSILRWACALELTIFCLVHGAPTTVAFGQSSMSVATGLHPSVQVGCDASEVLRVGEVPLWQWDVDSAFWYIAGLTIDADGAPHAYHPLDRGLDFLANAGTPGNWWALVTDTGEPDGEPVVQGLGDPAPGYYVSATSLQDGSLSRTDPHRYVDASTIPFIVLPPAAMRELGAELGDFAVVVNIRNGQSVATLFADVGPSNHIGEGSIALAEILQIPSDPRAGGVEADVLYLVFPGSTTGWPLEQATIAATGDQLLADWGDLARLVPCVPGLSL